MGTTRLPPPASRRHRDRAVRRALLTILAAVLLGACATGNVQDAGPAATQDAEATNVISGLEATSVVKQFFAPTPTPLPYPTRLPTLANLRLTSEVGDQNKPTDQLANYTRGGALYAAAQIGSLHPGQTVVASWQNAQGDEVASSSVAIDHDRELVWIALQWDGASAAAPGNYAVVIYVDGPGTTPKGTPGTVRTEIGSITFRVQ